MNVMQGKGFLVASSGRAALMQSKLFEAMGMNYGL